MSSPPPSPSSKQYPFNPKDKSKARLRKIGVWYIYEERLDKVDVSWFWRWSEWPVICLYFTIRDNLPYLFQMLRDVSSLEECRPLFLSLFLFEFLMCLLPALELACQGKLLDVVRLATEERIVDKKLLFLGSISSFLTTTVTNWLQKSRRQVSRGLNSRIKAFYSIHMFKALARLDVPTFDDPNVHTEIGHCISDLKDTTIVFQAISSALQSVTAVIKLATQMAVLYGILDDQPNGFLLSSLCSVYILFYLVTTYRSLDRNWAATARDPEYMRSEGLKVLVNDPEHRKEIVASGIYPFLLSLYKSTMSRIGGHRTESPTAIMDEESSIESNIYSIALETLRVLPDVVFALQSLREPSSIPLSVASLALIRRHTGNITFAFVRLRDDLRNTNQRLESVKGLYDIVKIPNQVRVHPPTKDLASAKHADTASDVDFDDPSLGVPFPENSQTLSHGISVEFRRVSFKYPGTDEYALRNVSFTIRQGQLCVIVGNNGSGKSTILKLVCRLYDPADGQILIDGHDIKTLRLFDLRRAISVLFQDYTIFPLSLKDNIGLGAPSHFNSMDAIRRAAELGGAAGFLDTLPQGYDTYLERPVHDQFSRLYKGPPNPFRHLDIAGSCDDPGDPNEKPRNRDLSGGQKQRIALSRTFMRTATEDENVGLLVFDEPSASLDPTAEHDLFERLRTLRGNKTMIFSSHRFGNLTRHADLILYMHESHILETGTHDELLRRNGEYARIWMLQAKAFL